ncbi:MAG: phosphomannomutase/phosphoglucomutase, partial [Acinetobacter sp.]
MPLDKHHFPFQIFRAYDIRGNLNILNATLVSAIAKALAHVYLEKNIKRIVLGYDARLTSPGYARIIAQICTQLGLEVVELGCCSTPMMYFYALQYGGNGIMVTASHNPKTDNGIKWLCQFQPPTPEMIQRIATWSHTYLQPQSSLNNVECTHQFNSDVQQQYVRHLQQDIQLKRPLSIVVDGLNGSAGRYAVDILQRLGCNV